MDKSEHSSNHVGASWMPVSVRYANKSCSQIVLVYVEMIRAEWKKNSKDRAWRVERVLRLAELGAVGGHSVTAVAVIGEWSEETRGRNWS